MASVVVGPLMDDGSDPPPGVMDVEDAFTITLPLDTCNVFISVDPAVKGLLAATFLHLAELLAAEVVPG